MTPSTTWGGIPISQNRHQSGGNIGVLFLVINIPMVSRASQLTRNVKQKVVYRDFNMNLNASPITGDLIMLVNADAVKQSIRNLVLTYPGERFYQPLVGSIVSRNLFDFVDQYNTDQLKDTIFSTIANYEPRAQNVTVTVTGRPQDNAYDVDISFSIVSLPGVTQNVPTIVLPVR